MKDASYINYKNWEVIVIFVIFVVIVFDPYPAFEGVSSTHPRIPR